MDQALSVRHPSRGGAAAARRAHNPEVVGSSPTPATNAIRPAGWAVASLPALTVRIAPGGWSEAEPPVPIPNTEVKRLSAEDTAGARGWEKWAAAGGFFFPPGGSARLPRQGISVNSSSTLPA